MATFPSGLFTWTTLTDNIDDVLANHPNSIAQEVIALENKIGVDGSAVSNSHDYKLRHLPTQENNWDAGGYEIRAETFNSDVATGTPPFIVASSTVVSNLNASLLNGVSSVYPARTGDLMMTSNGSVPSGWSDVSATYNERFIRISSGTALTTSGSDTHTHGVGSYASANHTHGVTVTMTSTTSGSVSGVGWHHEGGTASKIHVSTGTTNSDGAAAITGTSASGDNVPAYVQIKMYEKD